MGAALKMPQANKKIDRSPRYEVRAGDEQVLKFWRGGSQKKISKTKIVNISESGMAFLVDGRAIPHLGEIIKVDFHLDVRVVRYGRVVRLESPNDIASNHDISVAIEFLTDGEERTQKMALGLNKSLVPIDRAASAMLDANIQQLLLVSGFIFVAVMMGLVSH